MSLSLIGSIGFKVGVNWEKMIILIIIAGKYGVPSSQMPNIV